MDMLKTTQRIMNHNSKDKFLEWEEIRKLNEIVIQTTINRYGINPSKLLILGAGNGNDLPLDFIEQTFNYVEIVDIDETALSRLLEKVSNRAKFNPRICDLSGLNLDLLNQIVNENNISNKVNLINNLNPKLDLSNISLNFDMVLNTNFSTQLLLPITLTMINTQFQGHLGFALGNLSDRIHIKLFDQIKLHINEKSIVVHSTDTFELKVEQNQPNPTYQILLSLGGSIEGIVNNIEMSVFKNLLDEGYGLLGYKLPAKIFETYDFLTIFKAPWYFENTLDSYKTYLVFIWILRPRI